MRYSLFFLLLIVFYWACQSPQQQNYLQEIQPLYDLAKEHYVNRSYDSSILISNRALDIAFQNQDSNAIIKVGSLAILALGITEDYVEVIELSEKLLPFCVLKNAVDSTRITKIYWELSNANNCLGDGNKALEIAQQGLVFAQKMDMKSRLLESIASAQLANEDYSTAVISYDSALNAYKGAVPLFPNDVALQNGIPACLNNMGICYREMGNYSKAVQNLKQAEAMLQQIGDTLNQAESQAALANTYLKWGRVTEAKEWAQRLQRTRAQLDLSLNHPDYIEVLSILGKVAAVENQNELALNYFDQACNKVGTRRVEEVLEPFLQRAELRFKTLSTPFTPPQYLATFDNFEAADTILTQIQALFRSAESKKGFAKKTIVFYAKALTVAQKLFENTHDSRFADAAARYMERSKAVQLRDRRRDNRSKNTGGVPDSLLRKEDGLKTEIGVLEARKAEGATNWEKELRTKKDALTVFNRQLEQTYPTYAKLKYGGDAPLSINSLRQLLAADAAVITWFWQENQLFTLAFDHEKIYFGQQNDGAAIQQHIHQLAQTLSSDSVVFNGAAYVANAHSLYQKMFETPLSKLSGKARRLCLLPDGAIWHTPFALLLEKPAQADDWFKKPRLMSYLVRRYATHKLFTLQELSKDCLPVETPELLAFALRKNNPNNPIAISTQRGNKNTELPNAHREAELVKTALGNGRILTDEQATVTAFQQLAPQHKGVLLFTGHGFADENQPQESALVFYRKDTIQPYLIKATDFYNSHLKAQFVVASACETSVGSIERGEGVRTLGHSLLCAGSPSVMVSQWQLFDAHTPEILQYFFESHGQPKDCALQNAQLRHLDNTTDGFDPRKWAALELVGGDTSPLTPALAGWKEWIWRVLIVSVIGGLLIVFWRFRKK